MLAAAPAAAAQAGGRIVAKGRLKQSVCRWCYAKIPAPEFFKAVADMGLTAVDLLTEKEWPIARDHGLICSMGSGFGGSIADGLNVKANHEKILDGLKRGIPIAAANKVPNLITFFGNRRGMGDPEAAANCVEALNQVKGVAEEHGVTICLELLNSKVDHKDYSATTPPWASRSCKAVGSPRVKLLYDIYHMQIMEGDVIRTIRENQRRTSRTSTPAACPAATSSTTRRSSTGGPSRRRSPTPASRATSRTSSFPVRDPLTSLRQAVALCDV